MPFDNPVVAGAVLVRDAIQSENYDPGVQGWQIKRDGNAEFNSAVLRGELLVAGTNGSTIHAYNNGGSAVFALDPAPTPGRPDRNPANLQAVVTANGDFRPMLAVTSPSYQNLPGGRQAAVTLMGSGIASTTTSRLDVQADEVTVTTGVTITGETWVGVAFAGGPGWANSGVAGDNPTRVRRLAVADNVQLTGFMVAGGTKADGTVIFTLPAQYRPTYNQDVPLIVNVTAAAGAPSPFLRIAMNGQCSIFGCSAATNARVNAVYPLS